MTHQASTSCLLRICLLGVRMVTNSSAELGWIPTTVSRRLFFRPIFTATAKPYTTRRLIGILYLSSLVGQMMARLSTLKRIWWNGCSLTSCRLSRLIHYTALLYVLYHIYFTGLSCQASPCGIPFAERPNPRLSVDIEVEITAFLCFQLDRCSNLFFGR